MRIWQRSLILVTIPIVVGAANVGFLAHSLSKIVDLLDASKRQFALMQEIDHVLVSFSLALGELAGSFSHSGEKNRKNALNYITTTKQSVENIRSLGANDPEITSLLNDKSINETFTGLESMLQDTSFDGGPASTFMAMKELKPTWVRAARVTNACQKLLARARQNQEIIEKEQIASLQTLYTRLYLLGFVSAALMIVAIVLFNIIVERRLKVVLKNASRLPTLQTLELPLEGSDEFSELDMAIHEAFNRLQLGRDFRGNVMSMVAHDLRSPLASMNMGIETLRARTSADDVTSQKKLESISKSIDRMIKQISEFLDVQKMEFGKIDIARRPTTMTEIVKAVFSTVDDMAKSKGLHLELIDNTDEVSLDGEKISQVLTNLITNSIKFAPKESTVTVEVEPLHEHGIECRVIDRGPGLSEETRARLFKKYVAGEAVDWIGQSGLGLFIAGWIVQSHGGEIGLKPSSEAKGTIFWFSIPDCR